MRIFQICIYHSIRNLIILNGIFALPTLDICVTQECYETAQEIRDSINKTNDPCKDIYNYACDGWINKTVMPKWEYTWDKWQMIDLKIQERIEFVLDYSHERMSNRLRDVQIFYNKCTDSKISKNDLLQLINYSPLFAILNGDFLNNKWTDLLTTVTTKYNVSPLFKITVKIDLYNNTSNAIYIEPGDVVLPEIILQHPVRYSKEIAAYKNWIGNVSNYLRSTEDANKSIDDQITEMIEFELKLNILQINFANKYERVSIKDLTKLTGINWYEILEVIYDKKSLKRIKYIIINSNNYAIQLSRLLRKTAQRTIANFIGWSVIKDVSKYGDVYLRELLFNTERELLNVKESISIQRHCVQFVTKYQWQSVMPKYAELYVDANSYDGIRTMLDGIKEEFIVKLRNNNWMSDRTRVIAIEKINAIKYYVGYPEIDGYVANFQSNVNVNFLQELYLRVQSYVIDNFNKLWKKPSAMWPDNLFAVNAYYNTLQNSIVIPIALTEMPFYSTKRPSVYNYASLGFLLAHEMSHALDNVGRKINSNGRLKGWWTEYDVKQFAQRLKCYEDMYNEMGVNGEHTLNENIADNIGLELSHNALRNAPENDGNILIPYLENMNNEQLFYVTFAQLWCEIENYPTFFIDLEEHATNRKRVLVTLMNNPIFADTFYCTPVKSKCNLW